MRTDDLIIALARSAGPVTPVARPSARLLRWAVATTLLMMIAVFTIGPRADVRTAISQTTFAALVALTIGTALSAAASALVLSIPGAERSAWQRGLPLLAGGGWTLALAGLLVLEGAAIERLLEFPVHLTCVIEIAGLSLTPGWALFRMLRGAAPLERAWAGALAALAAAAFAALATQFICPIDDQAHHLVGHVLPVALLAATGAMAGQRYLTWMKRVNG